MMKHNFCASDQKRIHLARLICKRNGKENAKTKAEREKQQNKKKKQTNKKVKPQKYSYRFSYIFVRSIVTTFNLQTTHSYVWMFGYVWYRRIDSRGLYVCEWWLLQINIKIRMVEIWKCIFGSERYQRKSKQQHWIG